MASYEAGEIRMGNSQSQSSNDEEVVDTATEDVIGGSDSFGWADDDKSSAKMNNFTLCSSCGIPVGNYATFKKCDCSRGGCGRVKYCSDGCKAWHANTHKEELRDKKLFTQPEKNQLGECLRFVVYRCQMI